MAQQIKLKRSAVAGRVPTTSSLDLGEIAVNTADGKLYFQRGDSTIQSFFTTNALITGSLQQSGSDSYFLSNVGIGTTAPSSKLHVSGGADVVLIEGSGSTANTSIFAIDGNNGRLFEVSDDLSDSLFSVNTIAGLPVVEVFSDNRIIMGAFNQNDFVISGSKVGIGTATPSAKLDIIGDVKITGSLDMSGSINLTGDQREINILGDDGQVALKLNDTNAGATDTGKVGWYINGNLYGSINANGGSPTDGLIIRSETNRAITFKTNGNFDRMIIQQDGNVGIGNNTPTEALTVEGNISASGDLYLDGAIFDSSDTSGSLGQVLTSTAGGTAWEDIDTAVLDEVENIYATVKNVSGGTLFKGTPVHAVSGSSSGQVNPVIAASASDATTMPATFILNQDINDEAEGQAIIAGHIEGVDTSLFNVGDIVYVGESGGYTNVKPTGSANLIQNLGVVTKVHASNGSGVIYGSGRSNDVPNLPVGKIWVGSDNYSVTSSVVHLDETNGRLGIGTTTPNAKTHIVGDSTSSSDTSLLVEGSTGSDLLKINNDGTITIAPYKQLQTSSGNAITIQGPLHQQFKAWTLGFRWVTQNGTLMELTNDGKLGIGNTSPAYKLDVSGSGNFSDSLTVTGSLTVSGSSTFTNIGPAVLSGSLTVADEDSTVPVNIIRNDNNSTLPVKITNNNASGKSGLTFSLPNNNNQAYSIGVDNDRSFKIGEDNLGTNTRFVITAAGNVGIGTTSPGKTLTVAGTFQASGEAFFSHFDNITSNSRMRDDLYINYGTARVFRIGYNSTTDKLQFGSGSNAIMTLDGSGNLDVSGSGSFTDNISVPDIYLENSIYHTGDTNTSFRFDNDQVRIFAANYTAFETTGYNGVVKIGATNNPQDIYLQNDAGVGLLLQKTTGNVGIGTTSPSYKLHINGTAQIGEDSSSLNNYLYIQADTNKARYIHFKDNAARQAIGFPSGSNDLEIKSLNGGVNSGILVDYNTGRINIGHTDTNSAVLHIKGEGATSSTTSLLVQNSNSSTSLWVTDDQTVNARQLLIVNHSTNANRSLRLGWGSIFATDTNNELTLGSVYTDNNATRIKISGKNSDNSPSDAISMQANNGVAIYSGSSSDYFDPQALLHVSGAGIFTDGLTVTGSINHDGDLTVSGIVTAQEFHTEFVSASIIYQSGSTKFGDTSDDIHSFTGSLELSGSLSITSVGGPADPGIYVYKPGNRSTINIDADSGKSSTLNIQQGGTTQYYVGMPIQDVGSLGSRFAISYQGNPSFIVNGNSGIGIGLPAPTSRLHVKGSGTTSSTTAFRVENANASASLVVTDASLVQIANPPFTTSTAADFEGILLSNTAEIRSNSNSGGRVAGFRLYNPGTSTGALELYRSGIVTTQLTSGESTINDVSFVTYGNFGLGTSTPSQGKLVISSNGIQSSAQSLLYVTGSTSETYDLARFVSDNTDRVVITNSGSVGIGTTSPSQKLHVNGSIALTDNSALTWSTSSTRIFGQSGYMQLQVAAQDVMRLTSAGNVGIGTISPQYPLHIMGGSNHLLAVRDTTTEVRIGIGTTNPSYAIDLGSYTNSSIGGIKYLRFYNGTDRLDVTGNGRFGFRASRGYFFYPTGSTPSYDNYGVEFRHLRDSAANTNDNILLVEQSDGTDVFNVKSSGNVGIGTTSPASDLSVAGRVDISSRLRVGASGNPNKTLEVWGDQIAVTSGGATWAIFDQSEEKVGIGTTSPSEKLEVVGNTLLSGSLTVSGSIRVPDNIKIEIGDDRDLDLYHNGTNTVIANATGELIFGSPSYRFKNNTLSGDFLTITSAGKVGIGTTSPAYMIDVVGTGGTDGVIRSRRMIATGGTAADPAITTTSTIAGLYEPSYGRLGIVSRGQEVIRLVNNPQNDMLTLIGTTTGTARLQVKGFGNTSASASLLVENADSSPLLTVLDNGNVGIGNSSPTHTVEIGTDGGGEKILKMHSDTASSYFEIQSLGNVARLLATNNTNLLLQSDGTGGYITFNANSAERMRISYNGNVGIGTTSPSDKLQVDGRVRIKSNSGLYIDTSDTYGAFAAANFEVINDASSNSVLRILNSGNGGYRNISINTYGGKLGIGTLNPTETLTVEGNISGSGNLVVEGSIEGASKSFNIPHPTQPGRKLIYGSLEGPEHGVYCRGKIEGNVIELPEEWTGLVDEDTITVQLTSIGSHQNLYVSDIKDNKVFIKNGNTFSSKIKAFYFIQAMRKDIDKLQTVR